jgi:hypothetical protein
VSPSFASLRRSSSAGSRASSRHPDGYLRAADGCRAQLEQMRRALPPGAMPHDGPQGEGMPGQPSGDGDRNGMYCSPPAPPRSHDHGGSLLRATPRHPIRYDLRGVSHM